MEPNHPPPATQWAPMQQTNPGESKTNDATDFALAVAAAAGAAAATEYPNKSPTHYTISGLPDWNPPVPAWPQTNLAHGLSMDTAASPRLKAGPFFARSVAELSKGKQPSQRANFVPEFLQQCHSPAFDDFVREAGLDSSKFEPNLYATAGNAIYDRFVEACKSLTDIATIAIAFHGTLEDSIPIILKEGLDPEKRTGQAYGPGEYVFTGGHPWLHVL